MESVCVLLEFVLIELILEALNASLSQTPISVLMVMLSRIAKKESFSSIIVAVEYPAAKDIAARVN